MKYELRWEQRDQTNEEMQQILAARHVDLYSTKEEAEYHKARLQDTSPPLPGAVLEIIPL